MAESVVNFVVGKLGEMIVKEAQFLGEVGEKLKWVETELKRIKCYLMDADSKRRKGDSRAENWLNELRDVAYRIEDATDIFYVEIEDKRRKDHNFLERLKRLGLKTTKSPVLHKLGTELDDIKKVLEGIFESTVHYQINPLQERGKEDVVPMPHRRATYQDVDETEVVGLDADKNKVRRLLLDPEMRRRAVLTIVGPGGLGKTTLAQMVYKSVQADFNFHIMLPVSQQLLNDEDSRDLLIKKAFPYQKYGDKFPDDLHELVDALSKKCKGLPLALIVLGGILSTKDHIYSAWEKVLRTMEWHSDGKDCINILGMSYDDMPCYLKTCFLYLALFPEDY
ncbi:Disease resistance protein RPP13 [Rhynchospora pubera]|uniref:Disease resistance protein RPP13 n=1 Tax=Rhynchospora pubera TaxID=906938 RepID=A0AAV8DYN8_9POAL|nr:Disease resistance protein RPP13 [Rhynchospora pubera]